MIPISYNVRSLRVRKTTTAATALGIALVVFVFASVLMLVNGLKKTLATSGRRDVAVVLRKGADAEMASAIDLPNVGLILAQADVARRPSGDSDGVGENVVVILLEKLGVDGISNVQIRGVPEEVFEFRKDVKLVAGRKPQPGADECVIGRAIRGRFKGLEIGRTFELRKNRPLHVVGVFEAGGSALESEVWADAEIVRTAFGREGTVQSVRARLTDASRFASFERAIEENRQLGLEAMRESEFYEKQSEGTSVFITSLGTVVAFFFALGAMIGAMITMYAAVAHRKREIGTLRALGFGKWAIMGSFLLESLLLGLLGGVLGTGASLAMGLVRFSMVNFQSWSELVFRFEPTPGTLLGALLFAGTMGFCGGLLPAVQAARMPLIKALRE